MVQNVTQRSPDTLRMFQKRSKELIYCLLTWLPVRVPTTEQLKRRRYKLVDTPHNPSLAASHGRCLCVYEQPAMELRCGFYYSIRVLLLVTIVAFVVTRIRLFLVRRQFARLHGCKPIVRHSNKDLFLGLDRIYSILRSAQEHKALESGCERHRLFKHTFSSKLMFYNSILTSEPENIKTILSINFKHYGLGHRLEQFEPLLGKGIFDTDGDHWAVSRALIRPNFTRDQVADLASFENLIQDLFALIPRDGRTVVDLQSLFFSYTIDSATEFLFGQSVGSLRKAGSDLDFAKAFNYSQEAITKRSMLGQLHKFYRDPKAEESDRICREFAQQFVDEAVYAVQSKKTEDGKGQTETKRQKYIFSHELARRTSDKRRILDELMNILLAGRDTTASMLSNMFFMLAKHPEIWAKLRSEVASLEGRLPTYKELRNLKYLKCCMNECELLSCLVPSPSLVDITSATFAPSCTFKRTQSSTGYRSTNRRG